MSTKPSIYDVITLTGLNGQTADIRIGCAGIDYYEDLFSPSISVKLDIANSGGVIGDGSGAEVSLYEGLKITGGEKCELRILGNSQTNVDLDFTTTPLYVRNIKNIIRETNREFFSLSLVPESTVKDQVTFLQKAFSASGAISDHVRTILNDSFPGTRINQIDATSNQVGFIGNQMKPYMALINLASKAVSQDSNSAGFFFYQTGEGFNFRSIDGLISQPVKAIYIYSQVVENSQTYFPTPDLPSLDFKISDFQVLQNNDVVNKLRGGTYASSKRFFNPINFTVSNDQDKYDANQYIGNMKNLGNRFKTDELKLSNDSINFAFDPSNIINETRDFGTVSQTVTKEPTQNVDEFVTQRKMRYNTLFNQVIYIQVPLNTNLHAGDLIECRFPKISNERRDDIDTGHISGIYMIKELNHHFDYKASYTSMVVLRDTYGLYKTNR